MHRNSSRSPGPQGPQETSPPAAEPLRLAVVGAGAVAAIHHLPAIADSGVARAVAIVDPDRARARSLARRFGIDTVLADASQLDHRIDAAIVTAPNHLHAPIGEALLDRGIPVLMEKPLALSLAEADRLIAAADRRRAALAVGLEFRFFDATRAVAEWLRDDLIGPLRRFDLELGVVSRWPFATDYFLRRDRAGGGVLMDYGVHLLDLLLVWLGDLAVLSYRDDARGGVESDVEIELRSAAGLVGRVEISRTRMLGNRCVFSGERGSLEVGLWDPDPEIRWRPAGGAAFSLAGRARSHRDSRAPESGAMDFHRAFVLQLQDFAAAVRQRRAPRVDGREGRRSLALIEDCYARREPLVLPWDLPLA